MPKKKKITKVQLVGQRFGLKRIGDGAGDMGALYPLNAKTGKAPRNAKCGEIRVGWMVFCGAWRTTMFGADTWWRTSPVTEILEISEKKDYVKFKTGNSVYEARTEA